MSSSLVIPRKDARLAGLVMAPALVVVLIVLLFTVFGHVIPGVSRFFWTNHGMPPLAERLARIQWLIAGACFVVPCWTAVVIALGDGARRAQYLATISPALDSAKAMSKVIVAIGCAFIMWILYVVVAASTQSPIGSGALPYHYAQVLVIALGGAACGLGAANLVRRITNAGILAMFIPLVGLPIGYAAVRLLVKLPSPLYLTDEEWFRVSSVRETVQLFTASCAALGFAVALAALAAPMLAGRDTRPRVAKAIIGATLGALVVACVTTLAMSGKRTELGGLIALYEPAVVERAKLTHATDAEVVTQAASEISLWRPTNGDIVLALAAGSSFDELLRLEQKRLAVESTVLNAQKEFIYGPAMFEVWRRQKTSAARISAAVLPMLSVNTIPIERRIAAIDMSLQSNTVLNLARLLLATSDELDRASVIAELARPGLGSRNWSDEAAIDSTTLWCRVLSAARTRLQNALYEVNQYNRTESNGTEDVAVIAAADDMLSRPMLDLAARASRAWPSATPQALECVRKGLPSQKPAP